MSEQSKSSFTTQELILVVSRESAEIISCLDESLFALSQKRSTLEEKAISRYFHQLVTSYGSIIVLLHKRLLSDVSEDKDWLVTLESLQKINETIKSSVEDLLKIIRYNLNFLEQYFEYDYASKLTRDSGYLNSLESIIEKLEK